MHPRYRFHRRSERQRDGPGIGTLGGARKWKTRLMTPVPRVSVRNSPLVNRSGGARWDMGHDAGFTGTGGLHLYQLAFADAGDLFG